MDTITYVLSRKQDVENLELVVTSIPCEQVKTITMTVDEFIDLHDLGYDAISDFMDQQVSEVLGYQVKEYGMDGDLSVHGKYYELKDGTTDLFYLSLDREQMRKVDKLFDEGRLS